MSQLNINQSGSSSVIVPGSSNPDAPKRRMWPWIVLAILLLGLGVLVYFFLTSGSGGIIELGSS